MVNPKSDSLSFIANFVDAVTVRSFMSDLHRISRDAQVFRAMPRDFVIDVEREESTRATLGKVDEAVLDLAKSGLGLGKILEIVPEEAIEASGWREVMRSEGMSPPPSGKVVGRNRETLVDFLRSQESEGDPRRDTPGPTPSPTTCSTDRTPARRPR